MNEYKNIQDKIKKLSEQLGIKIDVNFEPDIEELDAEQAKEYLSELEDSKPNDDSSDEYDEWEDKFDETEELIEEVTEHLQELQEQ